mmetsp:Transcript_26247/g.79029  ORF Transcript_26247/g.79029 Transcript_26247/m.79029 type:complete len:147 (+) Transcript_26247:47-487(+)
MERLSPILGKQSLHSWRSLHAFHEKLDALSSLPGNEIVDERDVTSIDHMTQFYFSQSHYSTYLKAITTYLWSFLSRPGSTYDLALKQLKANDARSRGELYLATWATVQDALEKTEFQQLEDWLEHCTKHWGRPYERYTASAKQARK